MPCVAAQAFPGVKYSSSTGAFQVLGGCTNITSLPNITISLGSYNFTLTPQQYVVQVNLSSFLSKAVPLHYS